MKKLKQLTVRQSNHSNYKLKNFKLHTSSSWVYCNLKYIGNDSLWKPACNISAIMKLLLGFTKMLMPLNHVFFGWMLRTSTVYNPTASKNIFLYVNGDLCGFVGFFFCLYKSKQSWSLSLCALALIIRCFWSKAQSSKYLVESKVFPVLIVLVVNGNFSTVKTKLNSNFW